MNDAVTLWRLELLRTWQSKVLVFISLVQPLAWLFLFAVGFDEGLNLRFQEGVSYLAFVAPGLMALICIFWALNNGQQVATEKASGFLKEVLVAPVGRISIIAGRGLGVSTVTALQCLMLLGITAWLGEGVSLPWGVLSLAGIVVVVTLLALGFVGLGMTAALRGRSQQGLGAAIALLSLPMFFLSGALQPIASLPAYMQTLAVVNPLAHGVDALRHLALGEATAAWPLALDMLGLVGFALLTLGAGARRLARAG